MITDQQGKNSFLQSEIKVRKSDQGMRPLKKKQASCALAVAVEDLQSDRNLSVHLLNEPQQATARWRLHHQHEASWADHHHARYGPVQ